MCIMHAMGQRSARTCTKALLDLSGIMNRPQPGTRPLIAEAGGSSSTGAAVSRLPGAHRSVGVPLGRRRAGRSWAGPRPLPPSAVRWAKLGGALGARHPAYPGTRRTRPAVAALAATTGPRPAVPDRGPWDAAPPSALWTQAARRDWAPPADRQRPSPGLLPQARPTRRWAWTRLSSCAHKSEPPRPRRLLRGSSGGRPDRLDPRPSGALPPTRRGGLKAPMGEGSGPRGGERVIRPFGGNLLENRTPLR